MIEGDIAIIGAGIAGASLAAAIGDAARVILIEAESHPGYHAPGVRPLSGRKPMVDRRFSR